MSISIWSTISIGTSDNWAYYSAVGCEDSWVSLSSLSLSFNRLGDNIGMISVGVGVDSVVAICVWESVVVGIGDGWCLDLNSLDLGLNNWGSVDIGMVESVSI